MKFTANESVRRINHETISGRPVCGSIKHEKKIVAFFTSKIMETCKNYGNLKPAKFHGT